MEILHPNKKHKRKRSGASARKAARPPRRISAAIVLKFLLLTGLVGAAAYGVLSTPKVVEKVSSQRVEQVVIEGEINYISEQEVLAAVNAFIRDRKSVV